MVSDNEIGDDAFVVNEEDCCGNGCVNCILYNKPKLSAKALLTGKINILFNYNRFKLLSKISHTTELDEVVELHFVCATQSPGDKYILDLPPGHHIMARAPQQPTLLRPYSPFWIDTVGMEFKILVNLKPAGPMTRILSLIGKDDELEFRGPIGNYQYDAATPTHLYVITQGVAIATSLPIVEQVLDNEDDMSRVCHLICCTDLQHLYFRDRLKKYSGYWNYRKRIYVAHAQCDMHVNGCKVDCPHFRKQLHYKEDAVPDRLNAANLSEVFPKPTDDAKIVFVIAGNSTFQQTLLNDVKQLPINVDEKNIFLL